VPPFIVSAQMLLEYPVPSLAVNIGSSSALSSSAVNIRYANIGTLTQMAPPQDLSGWNSLPVSPQYYLIQHEPTLAISNESDAVRACQHYIIGPVNMVLANTCSYAGPTGPVPCVIRSVTEDVHVVAVAGSDQNHISRVDLGWEVLVNGSWQKFAILEFKRPGALNRAHWLPAELGTTNVGESGEKICRQVVKYAYSWNIKFVAACTWDHLVTMILEGDRSTWTGTAQRLPPISAQYDWTSDRKTMKRSLYVFLKHALRTRMGEFGIQVM
jgi:hypothetical protein